MGSKDSFAGGGGNIGNDLREGAGAMWTPTFPIVAITARQPTADLA